MGIRVLLSHDNGEELARLRQLLERDPEIEVVISTPVPPSARDGAALLYVPVLSERETEVLQLVADGLCSKEIAARLFVATKTVEWHRKRIMDKLGIHSVAGLTRYALAHGLVALEAAV